MDFENSISEIQTSMISLALEFAGEEIETIYIYGAREKNVHAFDAFFKISNKIVRKESFNTEENQWKFLQLGSEDYEKFCNTFKKFNEYVPTQLKLIFDNKNKKASAVYCYDKFFSHREDLTPNDIFNQWFEEEKQKIELNN